MMQNPTNPHKTQKQRTLDVHRHVTQQRLWKRLISVSHIAHQSAHAESAHILKRPVEPGPEDCCQSGCLNCVWEVYRLELEEYNKELAKRQGKPPPKPAVDPFAELERKLDEQKRQREELESSTPKAEKRTGHAQDAP
ncbi:g368 [Coccomyxa viridis]|uniref:G368 protein n=1 Tax=Coccomyxa viridis TaxID=1274662 RepID=A0ABP1FFJ6_9CHLO